MSLRYTGCLPVCPIEKRAQPMVWQSMEKRSAMAENLITCDCSVVWKLHRFKAMMREDAVLRCSCGRELITWSGPYIWVKERVQEPREKSDPRRGG